MKVNPVTEKQLAAIGVLPKGTYDFEVVGSVEKTSSAGNEMIEIRLAVYGEDGANHTVWDWLVQSEAGLSIRKLRHFSSSVGLLEQYEAGEIDADALIGRTGQVILTVEDDSQYGTQNRVSDYVTSGDYISAKDSRKKADAKQASEELDKEAKAVEGKDDLPF